MSRSESYSQAFWQQVPHRELDDFASSEKTAAEIAFLRAFLRPSDRILDLGCGWGRLSLALAAEGYRVNGLDLSENLVEFGRKRAAKAGLGVHLSTGNMLSCPFRGDSFDKVFCFWGVYNHLLASDEQSRGLVEMHRVLKPGGAALIEMGNGESRKYRRIRVREGSGRENRIWKSQFKPGPPPNVLYLHDRDSMRRLAAESPFDFFEVGFRNIHHKRRIVTLLHKNPA